MPAPWWTKYAIGGAIATGALVIATRKALAEPDERGPWDLSPPLKKIYVTQGWWETRVRKTGTGVHLGLDIRGAVGTPVYSSADGIVDFIDKNADSAAGLNLIVAHPGGISTRYMHLNGFAPGIDEGVHVKRGQLIGYVGISSYGMQGVKSGAHLHFETAVERDRLPEYEARYGKPTTGFVGMKRKVRGKAMSYVPGETLIAGTYRQRAFDRAARYNIPMHPKAVVEGTPLTVQQRAYAPWIAGALGVIALGFGGYYVYSGRRHG